MPEEYDSSPMALPSDENREQNIEYRASELVDEPPASIQEFNDSLPEREKVLMWQQLEIDVPPDVNKIRERGVANPNLVFLDFFGPAGAGKTTVHSLISMYSGILKPLSDRGWKFRMPKEAAREKGQIIQVKENKYLETYEYKGAPKRGRERPEDMLETNLAKIDDWDNNLLPLLINMAEEQPTIVFESRKTLDSIVFHLAQRSYKGDEWFAPKTVDDFQKFDQHEDAIVRHMESMSDQVGSFVILGTPQKEAEKRARGVKFLTGTPFGQHVDEWYKYFAQTVLPRLHRRTGVAYTVIDSTGEVDVVVRKVMLHVERVAAGYEELRRTE